MWLMLMSEVIRPSVIHVSCIEPSRIQHERIEAARMSISEIWKRLKREKINRWTWIVLQLRRLPHAGKEKLFLMIFMEPTAGIFVWKIKLRKTLFKRFRRWKQDVIKLNSFVYALRLTRNFSSLIFSSRQFFLRFSMFFLSEKWNKQLRKLRFPSLPQAPAREKSDCAIKSQQVEREKGVNDSNLSAWWSWGERGNEEKLDSIEDCFNHWNLLSGAARYHSGAS